MTLQTHIYSHTCQLMSINNHLCKFSKAAIFVVLCRYRQPAVTVDISREDNFEYHEIAERVSLCRQKSLNGQDKRRGDHQAGTSQV